VRGAPLPPAPRGLAELPQAARALALHRWRVLRPHLEDGVSLSRAAGEAGVALRTAQRWLTRYRADGLAGLVRAVRDDRGTRRLPEDLRLLIEGLALRPPAPSAAHVHRVVVEVAKNQGWPVPSYATVYAIIRDIDPAMRTLALDGEKRYREVFDLIHRREAAGPNEIWQADHTQLDLWVIAPSGKPARPWLTVIEDDYSRAVAGYAVNLGAPSAIQTALALRQAIWRKSEPGWHVCGIPATFYTDHGCDFTSQHLEQVAADLKIRLMFSGKGRPRGRGKIERYFETINQMCLPTRRA
jgi:putative transposase